MGETTFYILYITNLNRFKNPTMDPKDLFASNFINFYGFISKRHSV